MHLTICLGFHYKNKSSFGEMKHHFSLSLSLPCPELSWSDTKVAPSEPTYILGSHLGCFLSLPSNRKLPNDRAIYMSHVSFIGDVTVLSGRTFTDVHRTMCFFSLKQFAELFSFVLGWSASRHLPLGGISKSKCSRKQKSKRLLPRLPPRLLLEAVWPIFLEVRIFIGPKSDVCFALSLSQKWSWIHAASPKVTQPLLTSCCCHRNKTKAMWLMSEQGQKS